MRMRTALLSTLALFALAAPAFSTPAMAEGIPLPPEGTTVINLSATERTKLAQDTLSASLRIEQEGANARELQDKINQAMAQALAEAKQVAEVKTATGGYYVYDYQDHIPDPKTGTVTKSEKKWRGSQTIDLESKDFTKLLELSGKIQNLGFVMSNLNYSLSSEQSDAARDQLMDKALRALGEKARVAQSALGKNSYAILDVSVDGMSQPPVYPVAYKAMAMRAEAAADSMSAPAGQAGESEISLTVNARVLLKP